MKKTKLLMAFAAAAIGVGTAASLTSCGSFEGILFWGPAEHEALYKALWNEFVEANPEYADIEFQYGSNGDAGAYDNLAVDVQSGASLYTFANDQLANIVRIGAAAALNDADAKWIEENHTQAANDSGKIDGKYYGYPVSADNGYVFCYNKDAFVGTSVWDAEADNLKEGYTFRDLFAALDERGVSKETGYNWSNGLALWASGSAWYESGVFFGTGGDYSIKFDSEGKQESAECWFGYKEEGGKKDYTIGLEAARCMLNSYTNEDGSISKHFMYSDDQTPAYNDLVTQYITNKDKPLAGIVSWNNGAVFGENWGENYRAAVLPTLESKTAQLGGTGKEYTWKTFGGYKLMGINPYSAFARKDPENLNILRKLAQFLTGYDASMDRFNATGLGPSNLKAQQDEKVQESPFLSALAEQYALTDAEGNNIGYRVQDSTPTNFWDPIAAFGKNLYEKTLAKADDGYGSEESIKKTLETLQSDIVSATK